jgi:bifunctional non-homologous end joining protein LigD
MGLSTYHQKRDFRRTSEPRGKTRRKGGFSFVVQKHAARNLHYDFRLELDGVLLSWAVPKGPSLDPGQKRLAMQTEDHPVEYGDFEGVIPKGEYGAGPVLVWDRGQWVPEGDPRKAYARGRLTFELRGEKLRGSYHLVRTKSARGGKSWLLIKRNDAEARRRAATDIVDEAPESALSGRTIEAVEADPERTWHSNRSAKGRTNGGSKRTKRKPAATRTTAEATARTKDKATAAGLPLPALRAVRLTHPERVLYPDQGLTKADLALYYGQIAARMLPHAADRLLALVRCPDGQRGPCFFQKHPTRGMSPRIKRFPLREKSGALLDSMYIDDAEGLLELIQFGALELHTWGSRVSRIERPDQLTFDLDPDGALPWSRMVEAAKTLKAALEELDLHPFLKTTGGKGLHLVVPIEPRLEWDDVKAFCRALSDRIVAREPDKYLINISKAKRKGKILIDFLRNGRGATAVCPYSTRAKPSAPVAMPIAWNELTEALRPDQFRVENVPRRIAKSKDPWRELDAHRARITAAAMREVGARRAAV